MDATNTSITSHFEGFLNSAKKLEEALTEEKKRSQKIAQDYLSTRTTLENAIRELQARLIQRENKVNAIAEALRNASANEASLKTEMLTLSEREKRATAELAQYRSAWNEVLARESQARGVLIEHDKSQKTLTEQRNQIISLENSLSESNRMAATHSRHAETYQRELQSALIRIQSAEAKYSQIQKELAILAQNKRNAEEEISRIETSMRERYRWELATEKERMRAELEKDSALDRERFREASRVQTRGEIEKAVAADREARMAAENELEQMRSKLQEIENVRKIESERARSRLLALTDEAQRAKDEARQILEAKSNEIGSVLERTERAEKSLVGLRSELAMLQLDANGHSAQIESVKKEASKNLLMERLKFEAAMSEMHSQMNQLMSTGLYAEKIESAPEGATVTTAYPLSNAASSRLSSEQEPTP